MSQPARSRTSNLAALGLAAALALVADCYKPSVQSGGLRCAETSTKSCPDGFTCAGGVCVSSSSGPDASVGSGGHGGTATGGRGGSGGLLGTGGQLATGGHVGTGGVVGSGGSSGAPRAVGETCTITDLGAANQSDNCQTGAVCVEDCAQTVCFRTCASDDDCPGSSCTRTTTMGTRICEVSYTACDPHAPDGQQGCQGATSCYLLASAAAPGGGDRTVCDCAMGEGGLGAPCLDSRDCFPGLVCPVSTAAGGGFCRQACDPSNLVTGCPLITACNRYGSQWGYCY